MCDVEMQRKCEAKGLVNEVRLNCTSEEQKPKLYVLFECKLLLKHTGDIIITAKIPVFCLFALMTGCIDVFLN